jgi:hypothetical protein
MPRSLDRVCLQDGIKLDLNRLLRRGFLFLNGRTSGAGIQWTNSYWGDVAIGTMSADMTGERLGWFSIRVDGAEDQHIHLRAKPRHFGGRQWYFACPTTQASVSVLWRPNGATRFAGREAWGSRRVAYRSQFLDQVSRAHHQQAKIKNRLCELGGFDPDEREFPPKPKWMRLRTYKQIEAAFDRQEDILNAGIAAAAARLLGVGF